MSKQVLISEIPPDMGGAVPEAAWGKQSIGNYKGVMLCNRPVQGGLRQVQDRVGPVPFLSRVDPKQNIGINPIKKIVPIEPQKHRFNRNWILNRHKKYLKELRIKKQQEREYNLMKQIQEDQKVNTMKQKAAKQRNKVRQIKQELVKSAVAVEAQKNQKQQVTPTPKIAKLTQKNLQKNDEDIRKSEVSSAKPKSSAKNKKLNRPRPEWAKTQKMKEDQMDNEIDKLLQFAYDLDYQKYIQDAEVQQALALIKQRVVDIKKDEEWRENIANKWNQAVEEEERENKKDLDLEKKDVVKDLQSDRMSVQTGTSTKKSMKSFTQSVRQAKSKIDNEKPEWDRSTVYDKKQSVEDKVARKLVDQVMKQNQNLGKIHSKQSMRKILEKETKKQLLAEGLDQWQGPRVTVIKDHQMNTDLRPSNLPHLRQNPAI